jgi:hypothetical protein
VAQAVDCLLCKKEALSSKPSSTKKKKKKKKMGDARCKEVELRFEEMEDTHPILPLLLTGCNTWMCA